MEITNLISNKDQSILITSAGRRVELIKLFQKAKKGILNNAEIITTDLNVRTAPACFFSDKSFNICHASNESYVDDLLNICLKNNIKLVIPTIDTELIKLSESSENFAKKGINIVISEKFFIKKCRNKLHTSSMLNYFDIKMPYIINKKKLTFPCFMKPISGSSSKGIKKIFSKEQLSISEKKDPNNFFQELIPEDWIEYTADLYYSKNSDLISCVTRERIDIRGGEINKGIIRRDGVYEFLTTHLSSFPGAKGVITIQLFCNKLRNEFLVIEINPRFAGGYPMSHASGVDYPSLLIKEYILDIKPKIFNDWKSDIFCMRYDSMIVSEIPNRKENS